MRRPYATPEELGKSQAPCPQSSVPSNRPLLAGSTSFAARPARPSGSAGSTIMSSATTKTSPGSANTSPRILSDGPSTRRTQQHDEEPEPLFRNRTSTYNVGAGP